MIATRETSNLILFLYHSAIFLTFVSCIQLDFVEIDKNIQGWKVVAQKDIDRTFAREWKYLTFLTLFIQTVYNALCTINSVSGCFGFSNHKLRCISDFIFTRLAFPAGCTVTLAFWSVYLMDPNQAYPPEFQAVFPAWRNHVVHTLPAISVLITSLLRQHNYKTSMFTGVGVTAFFAASYIVWLHVIHFIAGFWVYAILDDEKLRLMFFIGIPVSMCFFYKIGNVINSSVWPTANKQKQK